jgi:ferredoxin
MAEYLRDVELHLHVTRDETAAIAHGARRGRIDWTALALTALERSADVYLCGPKSFIDNALNELHAAGVPDSRINFERFALPNIGQASTASRSSHAAPTGPFQVTFARSGIRATWSAQSGTLLELSEQLGLMLPANCRSGACGACQQRVVSGDITHTVEPVAGLSHRQALICCSVPTTDVVIDA